MSTYWHKEDVPERFMRLADRRTSGLFEAVMRADLPTRVAMSSAYLQGAADMAKAIETHQTVGVSEADERMALP